MTLVTGGYGQPESPLVSFGYGLSGEEEPPEPIGSRGGHGVRMTRTLVSEIPWADLDKLRLQAEEELLLVLT